jgi:hypothetical protein
VFWIDPTVAPALSGNDDPSQSYTVTIAQLTVADTDDNLNFLFGAQGRSMGNHADWMQRVEFDLKLGATQARPTVQAPNSPDECSIVQQDIVEQCVADCAKCINGATTVIGRCVLSDGTNVLNAGKLILDHCGSAASIYKASIDNSDLTSPATCTAVVLQQSFADIERVCCDDSAQSVACDTGLPSHCTEECADLVLDFRDHCQTFLNSIAGGFTNVRMHVRYCKFSQLV